MKGDRESPLKRLEHRIHPPVMYGVVPLFGFASAGLTLGGLRESLAPLPVAVALGLFIGKQLGVFSAVWLSERAGVARRPQNLSWLHIYAAGLLCGIGFTMSLFIGELAFSDPALVDGAKLGTLAGSLLAIIAGCAALRFARSAPSGDLDQGNADAVFADRWHEAAPGPAAHGGAET